MSITGIGSALLETSGQSVTGPLPSAGNTRIFPAEKVTAFGGAMDEARARADMIRTVSLESPFLPTVGGPAATPGLADRRETIKALDLAPDAAPRAVNPGDTILSGLKKLQGEFSEKQAGLVRDIDAPATSTNALLKLQMDMVQYTLMIDIASKITGKMTQAVDSLTKGQ